MSVSLIDGHIDNDDNRNLFEGMNVCVGRSKNGKWIECDFGYRCSCCGRVVSNTELNLLKEQICPCGARNEVK